MIQIRQTQQVAGWVGVTVFNASLALTSLRLFTNTTLKTVNVARWVLMVDFKVIGEGLEEQITIRKCRE
jgi:hypothetical protein